MTGFADEARMEHEYLPGQPDRAKVVATLNNQSIELWFVRSNGAWWHNSCVVPMSFARLKSFARVVDEPTLVRRAHALLPAARIRSLSDLYAVPTRFAGKQSGAKSPTQVEWALLSVAVVHRLQRLTQLRQEDDRDGPAPLADLYAALATEFPHGPSVRGWTERVKSIRGWVVKGEDSWFSHSDVDLLLFAFRSRGGSHLSMTLEDVTDEERAAHSLEVARFQQAIQADAWVDKWERYLDATEPNGSALGHLNQDERAAERRWVSGWEARHGVSNAADRTRLRRRAALEVRRRYPNQE